MLTSTMPEVITPGTDRAAAFYRDLIGGWPDIPVPAEGQPRHEELGARM